MAKLKMLCIRKGLDEREVVMVILYLLLSRTVGPGKGLNMIDPLPINN